MYDQPDRVQQRGDLCRMGNRYRRGSGRYWNPHLQPEVIVGVSAVRRCGSVTCMGTLLFLPGQEYGHASYLTVMQITKFFCQLNMKSCLKVIKALIIYHIEREFFQLTKGMNIYIA